MSPLAFLSILSLASTPQLPASASGASTRPLFEPALRVVHEFVGESAGDQFGWIGRNAGDCDGDGVNDVLLSAPTKAIGGPAAGRERIVALFDARFAEPRRMLDKVAGKPVYLILAMTPNRIVRVKPQNLLTGLPLKPVAGAN